MVKSHIINLASGERCSYCVGSLTDDEEKSINEAKLYQEFVVRMCRHKDGPSLQYMEKLHSTVKDMTVRAYHQFLNI